jgi:hypothetical protein
VAEFVDCVTGGDILKRWGVALAKSSDNEKGGEKKNVIRVRPHILKVDVSRMFYFYLIDYRCLFLPLLFLL